VAPCEVVVTISENEPWLWRAVEQHGASCRAGQSRRDRHAAKCLMRKRLKKHDRRPRLSITDKLRSYAWTYRNLSRNGENCQHKGLNNRAENSHEPTRIRKNVMFRFKSAHHVKCLISSCIAVSTRTQSGERSKRLGICGL